MKMFVCPKCKHQWFATEGASYEWCRCGEKVVTESTVKPINEYQKRFDLPQHIKE